MRERRSGRDHRGDAPGGFSGGAVLAATASVAAGLVATWGHRFPPLQDYPVWLYEASLLAAGPGAHPAGAHLVGYPVPNAANTAVIAALAPWAGLETAGRVFLTVILLAVAAGTLAVLRAFRSGPGAWPAFLLVPGFFFFHGNLNYVLGLGLLYGGIAYLVRRTTRGRASPALLGALTAAIFFCHAAVLAAWFAVLGGFLLRRTPGNRLRILLGQAPGLGLCAWAAAAWVSPSSLAPGTPTPLTPGLWLRTRVVQAAHAAAPLQAFDTMGLHGAGSTTFLTALNATSVILIGGLVLAGLWSLCRNRGPWNWLWVPLAAWGLAFLVFPPYLLGVYDLGQRFLPPLLLVGLAGVPDRKLPRWGGTAVAVAVLALLLGSASIVDRAGRALERTYEVMRSLDPRGRGELIDAGLFDYSGLPQTPERPPVLARMFVPRHAVLARPLYYLKIAGGEPAPIWGTGLLRASPPPIPFRASVRDLETLGAPDRLWLVGSEQSRREIAAALAPGFRVTEERDPVTILTRIR